MSTLLNLSSGNALQSAGGTKRFIAYGDATGSINNATESVYRQKIKMGGTRSNLYCRVSSNGLTTSGNTVVTARVGAGADGNQTFNIGFGATGEFEDTTHTDAAAVGDFDCFSVIPGPTGTNVQYSEIGELFAATANTAKRFCANQGPSNTLTTDAATSYFSKISGSGPSAANTDLTEATEQVAMVCAGVLQNLGMNVVTNTRTTATDVFSRIGGASGNLGGTGFIGASTTGYIEDVTHTDSLSVGNKVCWMLTTGASTTKSLTYQVLGCDFVTTDSSTQYVNGQNASGASQTAGTTRYASVQGNHGGNATESVAQAKGNVIATASNLSINVTASTIVLADTCNLRIDAAPGNQSVVLPSTVPGPATGVFTDAVHTDSLVAASEIDYEIALGSSVTVMTWHYIAMKMSSLGGSTFTFQELYLTQQPYPVRNEIVSY